MKLKVYALCFVFTALCAGAASSGVACLCLTNRPDSAPDLSDGAGLLAFYDTVFVAEIWTSTLMGVEPRDPIFFPTYQVRVTVAHPLEVWKGVEVPLVYLVGEMQGCSAWFRPGERYLVFAQNQAREFQQHVGIEGTVLASNYCDPNLQVGGDREMPQWLGEFPSWKAPGIGPADAADWQPNNQLQQSGATPPAAE